MKIAILTPLALLCLFSIFAHGAPVELVCVIEDSSRNEKGEEYRIEDISAQKLSVKFPSGGIYEFGKLYETEELLVFLSIAELTGSTTTMHLDKKKKTFLVTEMTAFNLKTKPDYSNGSWYMDFAEEPRHIDEN